MSLVNKIYGRIIIPSMYYLRGDLRFKYFNQYKRNLEKSKKEIQQYQLSRLKKLLIHSYKTVPYYTELFDRINFKPEKIKSVKDLKKIPLLDKSTLLQNLDNLKSRKRYHLKECTSGGSTGNRVVIFKDKRYNEISKAIFMRDFFSVGIEPGEKIAWIWSSPIDNDKLKKYFLHRLLWHLNRRILFNSLNYTDLEMENWLKKDLMSFKPDYLYGYPNVIYEMAKLIQKKKIIIPKIKKIICSAQTLEHREFIEKIFNCKVINQYGSREILSIAIEYNNYVMHSSDDFVIVEIGKNNEIILTPLESYGMPLIRYVIGDQGIKKKSKITDTYPFQQFNIQIGRISELLNSHTGEKISSGKINMQIADQKLNIGEFQLIQKSLQDIEIKIVKDTNSNQNDIEKLKSIIRNVLGISDIKITLVEKFPLEKNGKKIGYKNLIENK